MDRSGKATRPERLDTLMIRPRPAARMEGSTALVTAITPKTFVSNWARMTASHCSSNAPPIATPALLTRA